MQLTTVNARLKDFSSLNGAELLPPRPQPKKLLNVVFG